MRVIVFFIAVLLSIPSFSQVKQPSSEIGPIESVEILELNKLDNNFLQRFYKSKSVNKPQRFAEPRDVNITPLKHGSWESVKSGHQVWRQRIKSPGAYSLNLAFDNFKLPSSASLFIYNPDKTEILGPFTQKDNDEHKQLWTPMISGDEIVVELHVNTDQMQKANFNLIRINHDFQDIQAKVLSGSCNLDVVCGAADGWGIVDQYRDIISSVGAYTLNGIDQCTGVLINNTAQDCKPYFLTADHCDIRNINSASVVVFWNYQNSTCRQPNSIASGQPGDGLRTDFNTGAILRATSSDSDVSLIELDDPIDPALNLFFAGWSREIALPDTSICIHHPNVEEKRISFEFNRLSYEINNQDTAYIRVNDWDVGTTEPGSSGSPLFNSRKQIIGQLLGGFAACGNNEADSYGWFRYSWEGEGSSFNRLKDWLDPINSNASSLEGRSCSFNLEASENFLSVCGNIDDEILISLTPSSVFNANVTYDIVSNDDMLDAILMFNEAIVSDVNTLTISNIDQLEEGTYEIEVSVSDGENTGSTTIQLKVSQDNPNIPSLELPADLAMNVDSELELSIRRTTNTENIFQVSLDPMFSQIVFEGSTTGRNIIVSGLSSETEYFWRVKSANICGESDWSDPFSFFTTAIFCITLESRDGPIEIPETQALISSSIPVTYPLVANSIRILNMNGTHSYMEDLVCSLEFNGNSSQLFGNICDDTDDFNLGFDDDASLSNIPCPPVDGNLYVPNMPLDNFAGLVAGGNWDLKIEDTAFLDGGELTSWTLELCFDNTAASAIIPTSNNIYYCTGEEVEVLFYYANLDNSNDVSFEVYDRDNNLIPSSYNVLSTALPTVILKLDAAGFSDNITDLRVDLVDSQTGNALAVSPLRLISEDGGESTDISFPLNGQIYDIDEVTSITWDEIAGTLYNVELAADQNFSNIIFSQESINTNEINIENLALLNGTYYLRVFTQFDCGLVSSDIVAFTIDDGTYTSDFDIHTFKLYPNPSNGLYYIESDILWDNLRLSVFDAMGRSQQLKLYPIQSNLKLLDISELPGGVYYINLEDGKRSWLQKMVKI